jgi:hypothetical protein
VGCPMRNGMAISTIETTERIEPVVALHATATTRRNHRPVGVLPDSARRSLVRVLRPRRLSRLSTKVQPYLPPNATFALTMARPFVFRLCLIDSGFDSFMSRNDDSAICLPVYNQFRDQGLCPVAKSTSVAQCLALPKIASSIQAQGVALGARGGSRYTVATVQTRHIGRNPALLVMAPARMLRTGHSADVGEDLLAATTSFAFVG